MGMVDGPMRRGLFLLQGCVEGGVDALYSRINEHLILHTAFHAITMLGFLLSFTRLGKVIIIFCSSIQGRLRTLSIK